MVGDRRTFLHPGWKYASTQQEAGRYVGQASLGCSLQRGHHQLFPRASEDEEIRYLREGEVAAMAAEDIWRKTAALTETDNDEDPFAGLSEDEDELETYELVVEDDTESD